MLTKIKEIVLQEEIKKLDREIKKIYSIDDGSNYSIAFQWGFDTVANLNGSGYVNLVRIVDNLNDDENQEEFARFILKKALNEYKIKMLKEELLINRNRYVSILYL